MARSLRTCVLALLVGSVLVGCAGEPDTSATPRPSPSSEPASQGATLLPGMAVPRPTGRVVLSIRGAGVTNVRDELRLDLAQLESMETVTMEADDTEATGRRVTFSGPLMSTVLEVAGVEDATTLHAVALNDYEVDIPASDATDLPLMLATRMDGETMSVATYGPTRLVYPTEGYDLPRSTYAPRWIWQLETIAVE